MMALILSLFADAVFAAAKVGNGRLVNGTWRDLILSRDDDIDHVSDDCKIVRRAVDPIGDGPNHR